MGSKIIEVPNVGNIEFPDSMSDDQISTVIKGTYFSKPIAPKPIVQPKKGLLDRADTAINNALAPNPQNYSSIVKTNAIEVPKTLGREIYSGAQTLANTPSSLYHALIDPVTTNESAAYGSNVGQRVAGRLSGITSAVEASQDYGKSNRPSFDQVMSVLPEALGQGASTVVAGKVVGDILGKIPTKGRAGANFETAMNAAKDTPIDTTGPGNTALQIKKLAGRGGRMPKVVSDFIKRATDPSQGPITYEEARDFASNASELTSEETKTLKPKILRQVGKFANDLNNANAGAAEQAGVLEEHQSAMREYRQASQLNKGLKGLVKAGGGMAGTAALGYGGWELMNAIRRVFP